MLHVRSCFRQVTPLKAQLKYEEVFMNYYETLAEVLNFSPAFHSRRGFIGRGYRSHPRQESTRSGTEEGPGICLPGSLSVRST
jgi:hypothetical protein